MGAKIGFVLVTFDKPAQLLRLVKRLMKLYDNPPIVCHHDFGKCSLDGFDFPKEVMFVRPHLDTDWGGDLVFRAFFAAMRTMYQCPDSPEWFVVLSGTDYPTRPAQAVLDDIVLGGFDAYLDHRLVEYPFTPDPRIEYEKHAFKSAAWVPLAYDRWVAIRLWLPWYSWARRKPIKISIVTIRSKWLTDIFGPFSHTLKCYGGSGWFTCNRKAAGRLLAQNPENRAILAHYTGKFAQDECVPHTILCNQPDLKISENNLRYIDWSLSGQHPKILGKEDLPRIIESGAHFARKFDMAKDADVLDAIDAAVDAASH
jgi:hypothetical protein